VERPAGALRLSLAVFSRAIKASADRGHDQMYSAGARSARSGPVAGRAVYCIASKVLMLRWISVRQPFAASQLRQSDTRKKGNSLGKLRKMRAVLQHLHLTK
jgi:hypothetical protein